MPEEDSLKYDKGWMKVDRLVERVTLRANLQGDIYKAMATLTGPKYPPYDQVHTAILLLFEKLLIDCYAQELDPLAIVKAALKKE